MAEAIKEQMNKNGGRDWKARNAQRGTKGKHKARDAGSAESDFPKYNTAPVWVRSN